LWRMYRLVIGLQIFSGWRLGLKDRPGGRTWPVHGTRGRGLKTRSSQIMIAPISVFIPAYNHARFLASTIDSALSQPLTPSEIIVVDDGSTDDTSSVLGTFGHEIRVLRQNNRGVAAARNRGAAMATGDYLAFLDADDVWLPQKLEMQLDRFR